MRAWIICLTTICCLLLIGVQGSLAEVQVSLRPSAIITEEYTDNVNLSEDDEESEFITVISPSVALDVLGKTQGMTLSYVPGFTFYAENDENNTIRHSASLNAWTQLSKHLELTFDNSFTRTEEPYDLEILALTTEEQQRLDLEDYTLRLNREPHSSYTGVLNLNYQFGKKDDLSFGYRFYSLWDENPEAEDSREHSPYFDLNYWPWPHLGMALTTEYTRGEFSEDTDTFDEWSGSFRLIHNFTKFLDGYIQYAHTVLDFKGEDEDYQVYDPSVGITWRFARDASLNLGLGYYIKDNEQSEDESDVSITGDISKGFDISQRTSFRVSGGSGYEQAYFGAENLGFTVYYEARGRLTHALTRHLNSDLSINYRRNEFIDLDPEREDDIWSFQGSLSWVMREWAVLSLNDTYRIVDSSVAGKDYKENRVILSLSLIPKPLLSKGASYEDRSRDRNQRLGVRGQ